MCDVVITKNKLKVSQLGVYQYSTNHENASAALEAYIA
jgi:hypothetical protein